MWGNKNRKLCTLVFLTCSNQKNQRAVQHRAGRCSNTCYLHMHSHHVCGHTCIHKLLYSQSKLLSKGIILSRILAVPKLKAQVTQVLLAFLVLAPHVIMALPCPVVTNVTLLGLQCHGCAHPLWVSCFTTAKPLSPLQSQAMTSPPWCPWVQISTLSSFVLMAHF